MSECPQCEAGERWRAGDDSSTNGVAVIEDADGKELEEIANW